MKAIRSLLVFVLLLMAGGANAQYTDRYWCFGDSAGIDFGVLTNPIPANSVLRSRGTCASICDSSGQLLLYCGSPQVSLWLAGTGIATFGYLLNRYHQLVDNGDKLYGMLWYQEMVIIPNPGNSNQFYVFCAGVLPLETGLVYSVVDLSLNGGLGKVIQKNVVVTTDTLCDGITAVMHGNGRDWWIVSKNWSYSPTYRNDIQVTLVTANGITPLPKQNIGSLNTNASFTRLKFNEAGNHLYCVHAEGIIDRFDFDRCTGLLSNFHNFTPANASYNNFWGFEVSPDESKIYITSIYKTANQDSSFLFQFDLNASNVLGSVDTLGAFLAPSTAGLLQKGPDDKIYLSVTWAGPDTCFDYLYCYGTVNTTNSNISVINNPDSSGAACDFQPFSFYLGGHKAYWGLPNNPNYELGAWIGSPCDTLTVGLPIIDGTRNELKLYYSSDIKTVFVNAEKLSGRTANVQFYSSSGQLLEELSEPVNAGYFTYSSSFASQPDGVYIIRLITEKEVLTGKFVKR
jgi:hypothetical protein